MSRQMPAVPFVAPTLAEPSASCRAKLEEILAGVTAAREAHERGAGEQELHCERQLKDLEGLLQVCKSLVASLPDFAA